MDYKDGTAYETEINLSNDEINLNEINFKTNIFSISDLNEPKLLKDELQFSFFNILFASMTVVFLASIFRYFITSKSHKKLIQENEVLLGFSFIALILSILALIFVIIAKRFESIQFAQLSFLFNILSLIISVIIAIMVLAISIYIITFF